MLLSELQYDGVVIDLGHEMTQIVPFQNGHASFHQTKTFPVGGLCIDAIFLEQLKSADLSNQIPNGTRQSKFFGYDVRRHIKEKLSEVITHEKTKRSEKLGPYSLPDGTLIKVDHNDMILNGLECYLDQQQYNDNEHIIKGLNVGAPFMGDSRGLPKMTTRLSSFGVEQVAKTIKTNFKSVSLRGGVSLNFAQRAPITEELFSCVKTFCEDEEIKEYEQVKNILICGGMSMLPSYNNKHL